MFNLLIWLAILPSAILVYLVLSRDKVESEPPRLLIKVFLLGALSCIPAVILESLGDWLAQSIAWSQLSYSFLMYMLVVPCSEEFVKFCAMRSVRKSPEFDYTFDGIVYGVMASLGFATLENLFYVLGLYDIATAVMRAFISIPVHCTCGVFMGYHYGLARWYDCHGQSSQASRNARLSLIVPIVIHGLYDFSLDVSSFTVIIFGLVFTIAMLIKAVKRVRMSSSQDTPFGVPIHEPQVTAYPQVPVSTTQVQADPRPYQAPATPTPRPYQEPAAPTARPYQETPSSSEKIYSKYDVK